MHHSICHPIHSLRVALVRERHGEVKSENPVADEFVTRAVRALSEEIIIGSSQESFNCERDLAHYRVCCCYAAKKGMA